MPAFLGGVRLVRAVWAASHALHVTFESAHGSNRFHQLYAGRTFVGVSNSTAARMIAAASTPSLWPEHLTLLAVDPRDRLTDFGAALPKRPYNRARLRFETAAWPADAQFLDVFAGNAPGDPVDSDNRIGRLEWGGDRRYEFLSEPLPGTGEWNFEVAGVDERPADGNAGPALSLSQHVLAHPPDVAVDAEGNRLSVTIAGGRAAVAFSDPD